MRYVFLVLLCGFLSGCFRSTEPATPADQAAEEQMARDVLHESSPRNMNEHPKVTDEFRKSFNTGTGKDNNRNQNQSSQDAPLTKQSEDDEESWW